MIYRSRAEGSQAARIRDPATIDQSGRSVRCGPSRVGVPKSGESHTTVSAGETFLRGEEAFASGAARRRRGKLCLRFEVQSRVLPQCGGHGSLDSLRAKIRGDRSGEGWLGHGWLGEGGVGASCLAYFFPSAHKGFTPSGSLSRNFSLSDHTSPQRDLLFDKGLRLFGC